MAPQMEDPEVPSAVNTMAGLPSDYCHWHVPKLRQELKCRGAKVSGRKEELVERLESYDRNFNFGQNSKQTIEEYVMSTPHESLYKDLHKDIKFPAVTRDSIDTYLDGLNKKLGSDSIDLVHDRFVMYIKVVEENDTFFVKSQCRASMRKHVTYNLDVSFSSDGLVDECQCDCGAGMGPDAHCKHVNALLYAICIFVQKGEIIIELTCTQQLQTFHRSKRHKGSPIKACNLQKVKNFEKPLNFDPRPDIYKNAPAYPSHFRNICLNYKNISSTPVVQLYAPANSVGIAHDHPYLESSPEDTFLQNICVSSISESQAQFVEQSTREQSNSNEWKEICCTRINSSNFGRICKATDRTDPTTLARSLTVHRVIKSPPLRHGRKYEKVAIKQHQRKTGNDVVKCGSVVSVTHAFLAASPDGLLGSDGLVEVKCPFTAKGKISHKTVPCLHELDDKLTLFVPFDDQDKAHIYYYQIQGQLLADMKVIRIKRNESFIKKMVDELKRFYETFFRNAVLEKYFYRNYHKYSFDY